MEAAVATIIEYWGADNLVKFDRNALDNTLLPASAKGYLENIGIPRISDLMEQSLGVSFDRINTNSVVTVRSHFDCDLIDNDIADSLSSWVLLGHCHDKLMCICTDDCSVIYLEGDPGSGFMDWFVNSSIETFILFITLILKSFEQRTRESTTSQSLQWVKQQFLNTDPESMKKRTHWWPMIINDLESM